MALEERRIKVQLDSIFGDNENRKQEVIQSPERQFFLQHHELFPGKYQPRSVFASETLEELAASIKADGILQPLIVRKMKGGEKYEIIAGERRWRAAKLAGIENVPVVIRNLDDKMALEFALIENIQREDLNPIEQAYALNRLHQEFNMTHEEISCRVGRSRSVVTSLLRLLNLPMQVQRLLEERKIEMGHAKALLSLDEDKIIFCSKKIVEKGLSVRQAEELAQQIKLNTVVTKSHVSTKYEKEINRWVNVLAEKFASRVRIRLNNKGEGNLAFSVNSIEELRWLVNQLTAE